MTATTTQERTMSDPITKLANVAMHLFADMNATAAAGSEFAQAREQLGARFLDVAVQALRKGLKALLTSDELRSDLESHVGGLAAQDAMLGVAAGAFQAVVAEARELS